MKKIDKHIEIARTELESYSSMGSKSCNMIFQVLSNYYEYVSISVINTPADLVVLIRKKPDLVFLGLKRLPFHWDLNGEPAHDIWLSEYLEKNDINFTGSTKAAIQLDFNKEHAKIHIQQAGLPTAPFFTALPGQHTCSDDLPLEFPLFIKPLSAGGGKGIGDDSVVHNFMEFQLKVGDIFTRFGSSALVEKYLVGREFSVAILGNGFGSELIVMPVELITEKNRHGDRILGSQIKSADAEQITAIADRHTRSTIGQLGKNIYRALGARDLGRIDIRMDSAGNAYFLEANLVPGLADHDFVSYFNRACQINESMNYKSLILRIVELGLLRTKNIDELVTA